MTSASSKGLRKMASMSQRCNTLFINESEQFHHEMIKIIKPNYGAMTSDGRVNLNVPSPRCNHTATLWEKEDDDLRLVVFGGYGGRNYSRTHFNDVMVLDIHEDTWVEYNCAGNPPLPRSGHVAFIKGHLLYVFGGWNSETQFNDLYVCDLQAKDWSDLDLPWSNSPPRWNCSFEVVQAIPNWKIFIFGGCAGHFEEKEPRNFGKPMSDLGVLDLGPEFYWNEPMLMMNRMSAFSSKSSLPVNSEVPSILKPDPREYAAICYDREDSNLLIFGGWRNQWLGDMWSLDISSIVGPPYAVSEIKPTVGPVTGDTHVTIQGVGFTDNNIVVRFIYGKQSIEVPATFVSATEIVCDTPNVRQINGNLKYEVRVAIGNKGLTTTFTYFEYFNNTVAANSLAFGPGLLEAGSVHAKTIFVIQARNEKGENRKSGGDKFEILIKRRNEICVWSCQTSTNIDFELEDKNNGQYEVRYHPRQFGHVKITINYIDEEGVAQPIRGSPFQASFVEKAKARMNEFAGLLVAGYVSTTLTELNNFLTASEAGISGKVKENNVLSLLKVRGHIKDVDKEEDAVRLKIHCLEETLNRQTIEGMPTEANHKRLKSISGKLDNLVIAAKKREKEIASRVANESDHSKQKIRLFETKLSEILVNLKFESFYFFKTGVFRSIQRIDDTLLMLAEHEITLKELTHLANSFDYPEQVEKCQEYYKQIQEDISNIRVLWKFCEQCLDHFEELLDTQWSKLDVIALEEDIKSMLKKIREIKVDKKCDAYVGIFEIIKRWLVFLPLLVELRDSSMRDRHWDALMKLVGQSVTISDDMLLRSIDNMQFWKHQETVEEITDQAKQEAKMEKTLQKLRIHCGEIEFEMIQHKTSDIMLLKMSDENEEMLEENQVQVHNMFASRFLATFEADVIFWQKNLANIAEVTQILGEVQRSWSFLENLFIHSEEVRKELTQESDRFVVIDKTFKSILKSGKDIANVADFCMQEGIYKALEDLQLALSVCEKALNEFMDSKRRVFPRFYFVSTTDLLDILSNGNSPAKVMEHMPKVFQAINSFDLDSPSSPNERPSALGIDSFVGEEYLKLPTPKKLIGKVECYLEDCITVMRGAVKYYIKESLKDRWSGMTRSKWILTDPASQVSLMVNVAAWVFNVEAAFRSYGKGNAKAIKNCYDVQVEELTEAIKMVQGELTKPMRQRLMCLITIDTHGRDVLHRILTENVTQIESFQWQSQLKFYWTVAQEDMRISIADASFWYGYEYLGNGPRLVVTPLTDRIYVTATQALHLCMGCAPAGPAGTGKTETTKDLSSCMGKACYVFNCSDQMDYQSMGNIFKGLASSGSWGCFDEFNRLVPEVLSVCSVQFKAVIDAIKSKSCRFFLQGDEISLDPTCGVFITMNPGYLGRSELPEGLKALFRPITVVVPDLELICENMLMAEGFVEAKILARKFTRFYSLCCDLLSKAPHYDWGLRAIKSVLVVAGAFKREEPGLPEQALLMRALRDANMAKIAADDIDIFKGLLADLFPDIDTPRQRDLPFESIVQLICVESGLTSDSEFILKIIQLLELMAIRHCIFVMGPPGCGKSSVWKMLAKSLEASGRKTTWIEINPKAVTTNELYGHVQMTTREWMDGIFSKTMRSLGAIPDTNPKWIILDGDLDANWIESMNSVMDDNKILTLASNERIPLRPHMRMIFEIRDLNYATPATVSRAGIIYISDSAGRQWRSYVKSWIKRTPWNDETKTQIQRMFDKYAPETLKYINGQCKRLVPMADISMITSLCHMLEGLLGPEPQALEYWFVFCIVWAMGGCLTEKDGVDYRKQFSNWWKTEWKTIKFHGKKSVFDYFVDQCKLEEWSSIVNEIEYNSDLPVNDLTVPTTETVAMTYFIQTFVNVHEPVMLIGIAGCGKTQLCKGLLNNLDKNIYCSYNINFNFYTDSAMLQLMLEQPLEKKAGRQFGPPGKLRLVYFVDDLNMPQLDPYNTQTSIALLRQHIDYQHWYDRGRMQLKDVSNTQYLACMNPTAGSFTVNPRLQRHFWTLAVSFPEHSSLYTIFSTFMNGHFGKKGFRQAVQEHISIIMKAALSLQSSVVAAFRKTAANFHYEFNIRHLASVFQGLLTAMPQKFQEPEKLVLLWIHESQRTYGDRLVSQGDLIKYNRIVEHLSKQMFGKFNFSKYFQSQSPEPLIFCHFAKGVGEPSYDKINSISDLSALLTDVLKEYNETNAVMNLVLFEDAMKHVCRISRIISSYSGHALLVGVGGSGKQSLSRLASFICSFSTVQITISSTYGLNDLKSDLQRMYYKAGIKDDGVLFLFSDTQITNERVLVCLNDLLSSGEVGDLYSPEDKDQIVSQVRGGVKSAGLLDTRENCWNFFINRIKKNLHVALCFSPVGESLRNRSRKFPGIVNCTVIDWFQPWPREALRSVAKKFLEHLPLGDNPAIREGIIDFMPYSFYSVNDAAQHYLDTDRRYAYSTPKSFMEVIKLYGSMLEKNIEVVEIKKERLTNGLEKLRETASIVSGLEEDIKEKQVVVEQKKVEADAFAEEVGIEKARVAEETEKANAEAKKCEVIQQQVSEQQASCEGDLARAIPLMRQAEAALDTLNKKDFQEAKALNKPPAGVDDITAAVMHLLATIDPGIEVDKQGRVKDKSWKAAQKLMKDPEKFLQTLKDFKGHIDEGKVPDQNFRAVEPLLALPHFNKETIFKKSTAAAGLADWVINIYMFYTVVSEVEPKRQALKTATEQLASANSKLAEVQTLVGVLESKLAALVSEYDVAMAEKNAVLAEAEKCERKLSLAQRLITSLGSENVRWQQSIVSFKEKLCVMVGEVLLASTFVSYVGVFTKYYRDMLINNRFLVFLKERNIPLGPDPNPVTVLTTDAEVARWNNQGLPADRVSIENGTIMTNSQRWCLIIDPQLQGIAWIREKEQDNSLHITRMASDKMVQVMENAIQLGHSVLIENMDETIEAVLAPVIGRTTIKRGQNLYIKLGDTEITYHPNFKLYLHTKMSNPHYPPEVQAECTIINFTVTEQGLEDQLLALVVKKERPDLSREKLQLIQQQNDFKIKMAELEVSLLEKLTNAQGNILEDVELILNLETTKQISVEVTEKVAIAKETEAKLNEASENYRHVASRGALLFFLLCELFKMHSFYMYSLEAFVAVVNRAFDSVVGEMPEEDYEEQSVVAQDEQHDRSFSHMLVDDEELVEASSKPLADRVTILSDKMTKFIFSYCSRGLFEKHKLIVATMLTLKIMVRHKLIGQEEATMLIQCKLDPNAPPMPENCKTWMTENMWGSCATLEQISVFKDPVGLLQNLEQDCLGWRRWYADDKAETAALPRAFRVICPFHRLLLLRALRPDRLTSALREFVLTNLGAHYIEQPSFSMNNTYLESDRNTPIFFVLFPGIDPTPEIEAVAKSVGCMETNGKFVNISMGQGQELVAIQLLEKAAKEGGWVVLQNIHLMQSWLKTLERKLETVAEDSHEDFRCVLSSEPPDLPEIKIIPESILQKCIKVADEAPQDLKANLRRAFQKFTPEQFEGSSKPKEFKSMLFALCFFHSLILGRKKFGTWGWSRPYSFNDGDLTICGDVLHNYLEKYSVIPYEDIRYIIGEIMYGGHITDKWDQRVNNTYLKTLIVPELLTGMYLAPNFKSPDSSKFDYAQFSKCIEEKLPPETPQMFGLHPNAEIGCLTQQGDTLFSTIQDVSRGGGGPQMGQREDVVKAILKDFLGRLPAAFDILEIKSRVKEFTPYVVVSFQETERMNNLLDEIRVSLQELQLGLDGALNISEAMENLITALFVNRVPRTWEKCAYPSKKSLGLWFQDLLERVKQLDAWTSTFELLPSLWISGLFNPLSFLTALMQITARATNVPLDDMSLKWTVTSIHHVEDIHAPPDRGVYIHGLFLEGAAWEDGKCGQEGNLVVSKPKELHPLMPIMHVFAMTIEEIPCENMYQCPVYITSRRGIEYVCTANLGMEMDDDPKRWILAGVALLMTDD